jgi:heat shock protein HtpX
VAIPDEHCPECSRTLARVQGGPAWCVSCEWNLGAMQPPLAGKVTRLDRASHRLAFVLNQRLAAQLSEAPPGRPSWTFAKASLALISFGFAAAALAGLAVGVYLVVTGEVLGILLGVLLILIGIEVRPRVPRLGFKLGAVSRNDVPELYRLIDEICAEIGAPRIARLVVDEEMNASCGRSGLLRRPVLIIGLPLWAALSSDARLALLGHEIGHLVNGDPNRGLFTEPAMSMLARLAILANPRLIASSAIRRTSAAEAIANSVAVVLLTPVVWILRWTQLGLWMIGARDHQRAEIFADALAVRVGGAAGATELMSVLVALDSVAAAVARSARRGESPSMWHLHAQQALRELESTELVREQFSIRGEASMLSTHPPSGMRLRLVRRWPTLEAPHRADPALFDELDAQLGDQYRRVGRALAAR